MTELHARVVASETYWRAQFPNYDLVLRASGILAAVTPRADGTRPDPVLTALIYGAEDPAKTAYDHALVRLSQRGTIPCVVCGSQVRPSLAAFRRVVWWAGLLGAGVVGLAVWTILYG